MEKNTKLRRSGWLIDALRRFRPLLLCLYASLGLSLAGVNPVWAAPLEITRFQEFRNLTLEQVSSGVSLHVKGVILCYDAGWNQLYIHDGNDTTWLAPKYFQTNLEVGLNVEVTAKAVFSQGTPILTNQHMKLLGQGVLPPAKYLKIPQLGTDFGQWVESQGQVKIAETSSGRLSLVIHDQGRTCLVYVMGLPITNDFKSLEGCNIRIRGINASKAKSNHLDSAILFASGLNGITIMERPNSKSSEIPVISIESLLDRRLGSWTNEPVHLNGLITSFSPGEFMVIKDATGSIRAKIVQTTLTQVDEQVDVWGYLSVADGEPQLREAYFKGRLASKVAPRFTPKPHTGSDPQREITQFSEISRMKPEEASQGHLVRLQGVVTYADPDWRNCFIQSQKGAIYVDLNQSDITVGQWVEVTGQTSPGGFAPEVVNSQIRPLGTTNLPPPVKTDLEDLANGHLDSYWVELEGVVRGSNEQWGHTTLTLMTPKGRFKVVIPEIGFTNLIDAVVSLRGACTSEINARGQLVRVTLHVPGRNQITILEPVPKDPFAVHPSAINMVGTFDSGRVVGRRVKIAGIVTQLLQGRGFYVQDVSGGIFVNYAQTNDLHPGDTVNVLGFPKMGNFSPSLEEASVVKGATHPLPKPQSTTVEEILVKGKHNGTLVAMEAKLIQNISPSAHPKLLLQSGQTIFSATLTSQSGINKLLSYRVGSLLRLSGVCEIQAGETLEPESFRLLVADPGEIKLVSSPPWWTIQHTLVLVGSLALGVFVSWAWSRSLRRRVQAQTKIIRRNQEELFTVSRQAGMAEVATGVLHNVGNVLNSVNVSVNVLSERLTKSQVANLSRISSLIEAHQTDLGSFLTTDPKGSRIPAFISQLATVLEDERKQLSDEVEVLQKNVDHIKEIVAMQQSYAKVSGVTEHLPVATLIEDAIRMNEGAFARHGVVVKRSFSEVPLVRVDKHKVLQILVNLFRNAKYAMEATNPADKVLNITVNRNTSNGRVQIIVHDNGVGIPAENLTKIFTHGFTTKKEGHGFGLHSGALAAKEMGGSLKAFSEGETKGATFVLELPVATGTPVNAGGTSV